MHSRVGGGAVTRLAPLAPPPAAPQRSAAGANAAPRRPAAGANAAPRRARAPARPPHPGGSGGGRCARLVRWCVDRSTASHSSSYSSTSGPRASSSSTCGGGRWGGGAVAVSAGEGMGRPRLQGRASRVAPRGRGPRGAARACRNWRPGRHLSSARKRVTRGAAAPPPPAPAPAAAAAPPPPPPIPGSWKPPGAAAATAAPPPPPWGTTAANLQCRCAANQ